MPAELKPNFKRKSTGKNAPPKIVKLVNVEETLKALEQKEVSSKKKQQDNEVTKEGTKDSDEENVCNFIFISELKFSVHLVYNLNFRNMSKMKSMTTKWMRITIMVLIISIMVMIIMKKMTISTMGQFIKKIKTCAKSLCIYYNKI